MNICTVDIVSAAEQVSIISTPEGWHICYTIPDARYDRTADLPISRRYATYLEALKAWGEESK